MSDWSQTLNTLKNYEKNPQNEITKIISEVLQVHKGRNVENGRVKIAIKLLYTVCEAVRSNGEDFTLYNDIFTKMLPFISQEYLENYLTRFHYYFASLVSKNRFKDAIAIMPLVDDIEVSGEKAVKLIFEIYTVYYPVLITKFKLPQSYVEKYITNILKSLKTAHSLGQNVFLSCLHNLLNGRISDQILSANFKQGQIFFEKLINLIQKVKNVEDFESFYRDLTSLLVVILKIELVNRESPVLTLASLKLLTAVPVVQENQIHQKILTLQYFFLYLFNNRTPEQFNIYLKDVLSKIYRSLESGTKTDGWVVDTAVTLCEIFVVLSESIYKNINEENLLGLFELLLLLLKVIPNATSYKPFCLACKNLARHQVFNLANIAAVLFRKSFELKVSESKIGKSFFAIFNYATTQCIDLKCKFTGSIIQRLCVESLRSIDCANNSTNGVYALKVLDIITEAKWRREFITEFQLINLYRKLYYTLKRVKESLEIGSLFLAHLLSMPDVRTTKIMQEMVTFCKTYTYSEYDKLCICDILDNSILPFEKPSYDKPRAVRLQFEASLQIPDNDEQRAILAKKAIESARTEMDLAEIVSILGKIEVPDLKTKVKTAIQTLRRKVNSSKCDVARMYLALGHLYKRLAIFKMESGRKIFKGKHFSEATLHEMDINDFKVMDVLSENDIIETSQQSIDSFQKFYDSSHNLSLECFNWEVIIDDISYLARNLNLRGYIDYAHKSWLLIYNLSNRTEQTMHKIRAVSYFTEYSHVIQVIDEKLNIEHLMEDTYEHIIENFEKVETLTPRRQSYILTAILNFALYHARKGNYEGTEILAELVKQKLGKIESRNNCFELIKATIVALNFHLVSQHHPDIVLSPYKVAYSLLDEIKSIKYISSEDSVNIPALLFRSVTEIAEFVVNRLSGSGIRPYLYILLKFAAEFGLSLRMAQMLSLLANIDLQKEAIEKCQTKLVLLDVLLTNEPDNVSKATNLKTPISKIQHYTKQQVSPSFLTAFEYFEPTRKAVKSPVSPKHVKLPIMSSHCLALKYLVDHDRVCTCPMCTNPMYRMISFQVGCLYGRRYYLQEDYPNCEMFFEKAFKWWSTYNIPYLQYTFHNAVFWMFTFYLNILRRLRMYEKALQVWDGCNTFYKQYPNLLDIAYEQNLIEQKCSMLYSIKQSSSSEQVSVKKDLLNNIEQNLQRYSPLNIITTKEKCEDNTTKVDAVSDLLKNMDISEINHDPNKSKSTQHETVKQSSSSRVKAKDKKIPKKENSKDIVPTDIIQTDAIDIKTEAVQSDENNEMPRRTTRRRAPSKKEEIPVESCRKTRSTRNRN